MPTPGPEHKAMAAMVGTWDATLHTPGPTGDWMESKGVSKKKMMAGGFWLVDDFQANMMGMKFVGHGMSGYDPLEKKHVATWTDSMSPYLSIMKGSYDKSGKVLTMTGKAIGMDGKMTEYRYVTTMKSKNEHLFEMSMRGLDGKMMTTLKITYKRRMNADDKALEKGAVNKRD
ncbi:MAG: DUF1579 domain-containing protein [bacterium]|nr:DUF1579 domain-containing protein [bacterium]